MRFVCLNFQKSLLLLILSWASLLSTAPTYASNLEERDYFASLRADEVNVRVGPGQQYPIKFTLKLRSMPVKVISEYDNWSEIKDFEGDTGWVNQNLLTKKRSVMIQTNKSFINLYSAPAEKSKVLLRMENNVVAEFIKCNGRWCSVKAGGKKGWLSQGVLWGVDQQK